MYRVVLLLLFFVGLSFVCFLLLFLLLFLCVFLFCFVFFGGGYLFIYLLLFFLIFFVGGNGVVHFSSENAFLGPKRNRYACVELTIVTRWRISNCNRHDSTPINGNKRWEISTCRKHIWISNFVQVLHRCFSMHFEATCYWWLIFCVRKFVVIW